MTSKSMSTHSRHRASTVNVHTRLLATDMDGTLGLFWAYAAPAFVKIGPILAAKLGVELKALEMELGRVMHKRGTHEWPWVLEETSFRRDWKGTPQEFRKEISEPFWATMDEMRIRYLRPYPDVMETLERVTALGVKVCIVSDAPYYMALTRACDLGVDGLVEGLYALDAPLPDVSEFIDPFDMELGLERIKMLESRAHRFKIARKLPKAYEKPNAGGLKLAMADFDVRCDQTLFVGDSLKKDGGVAEACKVRFVWAKYGINLPPEYIEIIDSRFTPTGEAPKNGHGVTYLPEIFPPMVAKAADYEEVLKHLGKERRRRTKTHLNPSARPQATEADGH